MKKRAKNPIAILRQLGAAKLKLSRKSCLAAAKKAEAEAEKLLKSAGIYDPAQIKTQKKAAFKIAYQKTLLELVAQYRTIDRRKNLVKDSLIDYDLRPVKVTHNNQEESPAHEMDTIVYFTRSSESPGVTNGDPRITKSMLHLKPRAQRGMYGAYPRETPDFI